ELDRQSLRGEDTPLPAGGARFRRRGDHHRQGRPAGGAPDAAPRLTRSPHPWCFEGTDSRRRRFRRSTASRHPGRVHRRWRRRSTV
ncbi:MAG: Prevent host death protein, Phd antitoxin, partial [uncultured Gemmatimonadetes bacterium]